MPDPIFDPIFDIVQSKVFLVAFLPCLCRNSYMASYRIDVTEEAKIDLSHYTAFERKLVVSEIREQLTHEPLVETKNRKSLRDTPIASWELRIGKYRVFYEVNEPAQMVSIVSVGHKEHNILLIGGKEGQI